MEPTTAVATQPKHWASRQKTKTSSLNIMDEKKGASVNLNGISYHSRLVCTPLCICSLSTYHMFQGLLITKSEIRDFFLSKLWANSQMQTVQSKPIIYGNIGHMTASRSFDC
jgi:hypothetical protein